MNFKKLFTFILSLLLVFSIISCDKDNDDTDDTTDEDTEETVTYYLPTITDYSTSLAFNSGTYTTTKGIVYDYIIKNGSVDLFYNYLEHEFLKADMNQVKAAIENNSDANHLRYNNVLQKYEEKIAELTDAEIKAMGFKDKTEYLLTLTTKEIKAFDYIKAHINDESSTYYLNDEYVTEYFDSIYKFNNAKFNGIILSFSNPAEFKNALKSENIVICNSKFYKTSSNHTSALFITKDEFTNLGLDDDDVLDAANVKALLETLAATTKDQGVHEETYSALKEKSETLASIAMNMDNSSYTWITEELSDAEYGNQYVLIYKVNDSNVTTELTETIKNEIVEKIIQDYLDYAGTTTYLKTGIDKTINFLIEENGIEFYDRDLAYFYYYKMQSATDYKNVANPEDDENKDKIFKLGETVYKANDYYNYVAERNIELYIYDAIELSVLSKLSSFTDLFGETYTESTKYTSIKSSLDSAIELSDYSSYLSSKDFYQFTKYNTENYSLALADQFKASAIYSGYINTLLTKNNNSNYELASAIKNSEFVNNLIQNNCANNITEYSVILTMDSNKDYKSDTVTEIKSSIEPLNVLDSTYTKCQGLLNMVYPTDATTIKSEDGITLFADVNTIKDNVSIFKTYQESDMEDIRELLDDESLFNKKDGDNFVLSDAYVLDVVNCVKNCLLYNLKIETSSLYKATGDDNITKINTEIGDKLGQFVKLNLTDMDVETTTNEYVLIFGVNQASYNFKYSDSIDETNPYYNTDKVISKNQIGEALYEYIMYTVKSSDYTKSSYYSTNSSSLNTYATSILAKYDSTYVEKTLVGTIVSDDASLNLNFNELYK